MINSGPIARYLARTCCAAAVLAALLTGCGDNHPSPTVGEIPAAQTLEGVRWEPVPNGNRETEGAYLTFDDALNWHASDGCTTSQGTYDFFPKSDGRVITQRRGDILPGQRCAGVPTASTLEQATFLRTDKGRLLLISANNQVILRLEPPSGL